MTTSGETVRVVDGDIEDEASSLCDAAAVLAVTLAASERVGDRVADGLPLTDDEKANDLDELEQKDGVLEGDDEREIDLRALAEKERRPEMDLEAVGDGVGDDCDTTTVASAKARISLKRGQLIVGATHASGNLPAADIAELKNDVLLFLWAGGSFYGPEKTLKSICIKEILMRLYYMRWTAVRKLHRKRPLPLPFSSCASPMQ